MAYTSEVSFSTYIRARLEYTYSEVSNGHSVTVKLQLRRTNTYSGDTTPNIPSSSVITIDGTSNTSNWTSSNYPKVPGNNNSWQTFKTYTRTVEHTDSKTISIKGENKNMGSYLTGSVSGSFTLPAISATPPDTPSCSASSNSASLVNVSWGTSDLGIPTGTVSLYTGTTNDPTEFLYSKSTTGISVFGHDQRTANTTYYYKAIASNTAGTVSSAVTSATTYPAGISATSVSDIEVDSATLRVQFDASGNALTTGVQARINQSGTWDDLGLTDVQGTTQNITLASLTPDTQYTVELRVYTSAGVSTVASVSFRTLPPVKLYGSVNGQTKLINKLYGSTAGQNIIPRPYSLIQQQNGITFTVSSDGNTITLDGQNDGNGNSVKYITRIKYVTFQAGTYHFTSTGNNAIHFELYNSDTQTYTRLDHNNNYTLTLNEATTYRDIYVEVSRGDTTVFDNYSFPLALYDDSGHTVEIEKLYGSVNGQTKLIYQG